MSNYIISDVLRKKRIFTVYAGLGKSAVIVYTGLEN